MNHRIGENIMPTISANNLGSFRSPPPAYSQPTADEALPPLLSTNDAAWPAPMQHQALPPVYDPQNRPNSIRAAAPYTPHSAAQAPFSSTSTNQEHFTAQNNAVIPPNTEPARAPRDVSTVATAISSRDELEAIYASAENAKRSINKTMGPWQRHFANSIGFVGGALTWGAAAAAGVGAYLALASAGSIVGVHLGLIIAAASVAALALAALSTIVVAAVAQKMVRSGVKKNPELTADIARLQAIRQKLETKKKNGDLTKNELRALKKVNRVLGKVGTFGDHFKEQAKNVGRAMAWPLYVVGFVAQGGAGLGF